MSVLEAIEKIERAVAEQDAAIQRRANNMFLGPVGIEERIDFVETKAGFCLWALGRLCVALKEERKAVSELEGDK